MFTRRDFIATSAATASSPLAGHAANERDVRLPLKAQPRVRTLFTKPTGDGRLLLFSDGPKSPSKLIKPEALERAFGPGTDLVLQQPDHWRMVEAGWFAEEDLYEPTDFEDPTFLIWHANYRPETEAHDLLCDLFRDHVTGPFGAGLPDLRLELGEHPSTPRYATATLDGDWCLPRLMDEVAARTAWLVDDGVIASGELER
ncbi:hypothetical protein [Thalassobacter stenotrophicus]|uniref:hypothetical protein n=1 Tax=Thalassobacter stenotrophicus TaxID=266809 RepID=UPI000D5E0B71|nr:hypothetical protein [Thalassobacter stenotrophicus]PVZ48382.1 hypothetical protein DD557_06340 [Thalassobacter stenotrophicus]